MRFQVGELGSWTIRCVLTAYIQERRNSNQSLSQSTMDCYLVRYVYSVALRSEYIITWREVDPYSQVYSSGASPCELGEHHKRTDNMQTCLRSASGSVRSVNGHMRVFALCR
jgi:hypothetical protein